MNNLKYFSISWVVFFAAGFVASAVLVASSFVVELLLFPVRLFSWAVSFGVSCSSLLRSLFRHTLSVFYCGSFSPFCLQHSVAMLASNLAFERDAAKARRPSTLRWAYKPTAGLKCFSVVRCQVFRAALC